MKKLRCASFFAGVGGIDLGFEQTGAFKTVYANEFDEYAAKTYEENFNIKVDCRSINEVKPEDVPDVDVIIGARTKDIMILEDSGDDQLSRC